MSIKKSKQTAIQHHLQRIQSIAASELIGLATQGPDGAREAIEAIEDNTTAILSVVEDPDDQWTDSADDTPKEPTGTPGRAAVYMYVVVMTYGYEHQPDAQVFLQPGPAVRYAIRTFYEGADGEHDAPAVIQGAVERVERDGEYAIADGNEQTAHVYRRAVR